MIEFLIKVFGETILGELLKFAQNLIQGQIDELNAEEKGAAKAVNEINADTSKIQKDMADAQANAPATPADIAAAAADSRLRRAAVAGHD